MKNVLITGITGQDGGYLAKLLLSKSYKVYGAQRRNTGKKHWRLDELNITDHINFVDIDLSEPYNIEKVIDKVQPDEIYNLAAQSFVGLSFDQPPIYFKGLYNPLLPPILHRVASPLSTAGHNTCRPKPHLFPRDHSPS